MSVLPWLGPAVLLVIIARWLWSKTQPAPVMDLTIAAPVQFPLPEGTWEAFNSPASRVPSHGTDWLGQRFALDLVGIKPDEGYATARDWKSRFGLESPERFHGFGAPVIAPCAGRVIVSHDGVADRRACRSWVGLAWFFASSIVLGIIPLVVRRPAGTAAVAGNHVIIEVSAATDETYVALMHLRQGSVTVKQGDEVRAGDLLGRVGNTGNTTQPHLHIQLTRRATPQPADGREMAFTNAERDTGAGWVHEPALMPRTGEYVRARRATHRLKESDQA